MNRMSFEKKRMSILAAFFLLLMLGVLYRSFTFQVINRKPWVEKLAHQNEFHKILPAVRGMIYDRNMNVLAMDLSVTGLAVDPTEVENSAALICSLQTVLGGREDVFRDLVYRGNGNKYVPVKSIITLDQKERLAAAGFKSLIFEPKNERVRPAFDLAKQVLGIISKKNGKGAWGIEQELDSKLSGTDGWAIERRDGLNRKYESLELPVKQPKAGNDVVLTIDHVMQAIVEEEIDKGVRKYGAKFGTAVLVDPFTGDVLAMASAVGTAGVEFNETMRNRAVQWDFEPGSVFKIVTLAAAFEDGAYKPESLIFCENGSYKVANHIIHDHDESYAWLTLNQVIAHSSNIGITKVGQNLGPQKLFKYIRDFGFGNRTGIGLPGEARGILRPVYQWTSFSIASISFGQEISSTVVQLAMMTSVIANGGNLLQPRLVAQIMDNDGVIVKASPYRVIRKVISSETAAKVTDVLINVVNKGSGIEAGVRGIKIAGKTGTAQKSAPGFQGYMPDAAVCSFVGFWPAKSPMYTLVVVLDEPSRHAWGSKSAAPVFANIAKRLTGLPARQVTEPFNQPPDKSGDLVFTNLEEKVREPDKSPPLKSRQKESRYHIPKLTGLSVRQAMLKLVDLKIEAKITGSGIVRKQIPLPGKKITSGMTCHLICGSKSESGP